MGGEWVLIMDEAAVGRALARISHEIIERNPRLDSVCLVGIRRRGAPIARLLCGNILKYAGVSVPVGELDITFYRDDLTAVADMPRVRPVELPFDVTGKSVILADDVIYTGRTARAAIDALFQAGRPASVQLAALIDRGHRELPIRPDYVGKNIPTARSEVVEVALPEYDGRTGVTLRKNDGGAGI